MTGLSKLKYNESISIYRQEILFYKIKQKNLIKKPSLTEHV